MDVAIQNRAMARSLRILTFAGRPQWLAAVTAIGHRWDVVETPAGGYDEWWARTRALPAPARAVRPLQAAMALTRGAYDLVVCHDVDERRWIGQTPTPIVAVFHARETLAALFGDGRAALDPEGGALWDGTHRVFASEEGRRTWGERGEVIVPGVPLNGVPWDGSDARVLVVGDFLNLLAPINGSSALDAVVEGLPTTVRGLNPGVEERAPTPAALAEAMRTHRVFLHASQSPVQEGYSHALLLAMAAGMPVVSLAHPESPIVDGVNGFVSADPQVLRARVEALLADHACAARLGAAARDTVRRAFPLTTFQARWRALVERVTSDRHPRVA